MKTKSIKEVLYNYLADTNFKEINEQINIETLWKNNVGKTISNNTKIISYKKGTLSIKTSNSIWRNELSLQKQDLINKIKEALPELKIKDITFR